MNKTVSMEAQLVDMQKSGVHMMMAQFIVTNNQGEKHRKQVPICMVDDDVMQMDRKGVYDFALSILKQMLSNIGIGDEGVTHDYRENPVRVNSLEDDFIPAMPH